MRLPDAGRRAGTDAESTGDFSADVDERTRFELIEAMYAATPPSVWAGVGFAAVIALLVSSFVPALAAGLWFALKLLIGFWRATDARRFGADPRRRQKIRYWTGRYQLLMGVDALSWAAMLVVFGPHATGLPFALLMAGLVGVSSIGVYTTITHLPSTLIFTLATLGPMALYFLFDGSLAGVAIAVSTCIYLGVLLSEAWRSHDRHVMTLRLRFENAVIAEERAHALAAAQSSDQAKSRFLAVVSHEMRTPLNGILGMAQVMHAESREPKQRRRIEIVQRSARHLNRVIGDLLDLSRIEFDKLVIEQTEFVIKEVVGEVAELQSGMANDRALRLRVVHAPGMPRRAVGDPSRIKQVLHNLLGNAIKFTARGEVLLEVKAPAPGLLRFDVHDSGPGIAPEQIGRIFEAFEQGTQLGALPGTGLGLTISRRLARAMGGDVSCVSTPGVGSVFSFTLLVREAPADPARAARSEPTRPAELGPAAADVTLPPRARRDPPTSLAPMNIGRVLVVDDNEVNALVARSMLHLLGVKTDVAADGQQALDAMAKSHYSAVLMDCHMPRLDGWEATRRWRAAETGKRLPIIGVTANAADEDRRACINAGMDDHLAKPYLMDNLAALLRRHAAAAQ